MENELLRDTVENEDCNATKPNIGFPFEPGWEIMNGKLVSVHIKGSKAPELLEYFICSCSSISRCTINCSCAQNNLYCTELCICHSNDNSTFNWPSRRSA